MIKESQKQTNKWWWKFSHKNNIKTKKNSCGEQIETNKPKKKNIPGKPEQSRTKNIFVNHRDIYMLCVTKKNVRMIFCLSLCGHFRYLWFLNLWNIYWCACVCVHYLGKWIFFLFVHHHQFFLLSSDFQFLCVCVCFFYKPSAS